MGHKDINRQVLLLGQWRTFICHVAKRPTEDSGTKSGPDPDTWIDFGYWTPALVVSHALIRDTTHEVL